MAEIHHRQGWNHKAADYLQMALDRLPVELNRDRSSIEEKIVALRARLEKEKIDPKKKSWNEWLEILLNSVEVERRREAVREVARFPWVDPKIPQALLRALGDSDPEVRIIALKVLGREWPDDDSETLIKLARILVRHKDEKLRAVAARVLGRTNHPASVPALIRVIEEPSPYVFREIHNSLNRVTNAYVEVVAPEEMDEAVRKRIGSAWKAWYEANRDRYAKFEEERK
jgi:HEAT repeat protein